MTNLVELEELAEPYWSDHPVSKTFDIGEGWYDLVHELISALIALKRPFKIVQIKEKLGGLRFYVEGANSQTIHTFIDCAENESFRTCDICGAEGELISRNGWRMTRCSEHSIPT